MLTYPHNGKNTRRRMKSLLVFTTILAILFICITLRLLFKNYILTKKMKYVDEANMWHKLAITDDLTGIYNRNAYNLHMDKIKNETNKKLRGLLLFDVDDFKIINDTKGHLAGDVVLKDVAKNLLEVFCESQYSVFRIGGDEFSVLSESIAEKEIIERLIALDQKLEVDGNIRLSKGYSMINDTPEKAFKCADEMLYADKISKKLRSSAYKPLER